MSKDDPGVDVSDVVLGHQLQAHAKRLTEAILADPGLPPGTNVIVVLCRPPVHATWARGPNWKPLLDPVDEVVHVASHELARKNA